MKYLIVSIYDSGYEFSVCKNGRVYQKYSKNGKYVTEAKVYLVGYGEVLRDYLEKKYKDYDLIVICEDGNTQVVVDKTKPMRT